MPLKAIIISKKDIVHGWLTVGLIFIFPHLAPFVLKVLNGWSAFEVKLDASQVDCPELRA